MRQEAAARWWRTGWGGSLGHPLAMLAVLCQLLVAVLLPIPSVAAATPVLAGAASVICHGDGGVLPARHHAPVHHPAGCAVCPLCLATALPAMLASTPPSAPAPRTRWLAVVLPPTRAGPSVGDCRLAAQPRGPPASV